jgi:predicted acylesterase/phospholipase RssA
MSPKLGLALSGGGSRAAAFHCGTLRALHDIGLADRIDVISSVSGGSFFAGAWMAARAEGVDDIDFLQKMQKELRGGFIIRSVRPSAVKVLLPGYTLTNVLARTFDKIFLSGKKLKDLPAQPRLCINTAILNNGQVGKFYRSGFSAWGLHKPDAQPSHHIPLPEFPLSLAIAASAAFPVGLPPIALKKKALPSDVSFRGSLNGARALALADGGILENLGIQTLLKSRRFGTWNMVVSDAGSKGKPWNPGSIDTFFRSFFAGALCGPRLARLMMVMNDKQNRWARQQVVEQIHTSWMAECLRTGQIRPSTEKLLSEWQSLPRRKVLFVRVAQNWRSFLYSIPTYRLMELAGATGQAIPDHKDSEEVENFLEEVGVDLSEVRRYYAELGGDAGAAAANEVPTSFTALSDEDSKKLEAHAAWQIHATYQVYGI